MTLDKPYFMTNQEWYEDDIETGKLKLTDKAPPKAIESYNEFYKIMQELKGIKETN